MSLAWTTARTFVNNDSCALRWLSSARDQVEGDGRAAPSVAEAQDRCVKVLALAATMGRRDETCGRFQLAGDRSIWFATPPLQGVRVRWPLRTFDPGSPENRSLRMHSATALHD